MNLQPLPPRKQSDEQDFLAIYPLPAGFEITAFDKVTDRLSLDYTVAAVDMKMMVNVGAEYKQVATSTNPTDPQYRSVRNALVISIHPMDDATEKLWRCLSIGTMTRIKQEVEKEVLEELKKA